MAGDAPGEVDSGETPLESADNFSVLVIQYNGTELLPFYVGVHLDSFMGVEEIMLYCTVHVRAVATLRSPAVTGRVLL